MNPRLVASLAPRLMATAAIGAAVILGTAGCSMVSTQATASGTPPPTASRPRLRPVLVRNALIVANEEGTEGNFLAAIINTTDEPQELSHGVRRGLDRHGPRRPR